VKFGKPVDYVPQKSCFGKLGLGLGLELELVDSPKLDLCKKANVKFEETTRFVRVCIRTAAARELCAERAAEFGRHGVVEDRIDGAVSVDGETTEQQEPAILVALSGERVVHYVRPIRQPQRREHRHDHSQHLHNLRPSINASKHQN